jgi:molybdopterin converting factor small subunit
MDGDLAGGAPSSDMTAADAFARFAVNRCTGEPTSSANRIDREVVSCTVELFGMARLLAKTRMVDLELARPATLGGVFSSLAEKLPNLVGRVIDQSKSRLIGACACNVNGLEFVRDPAAEIRSGDKVLILPADAGG